MALSKSAAVIGLLVFGTASSVSSKILYEMRAPPGPGQSDTAFEKPWFVTLIMFVAMSFCLPLSWMNQRAKAHPAHDSFDGSQPRQVRSELRQATMLIAPTVLDLVATALMSVGLLSVTASVYQMMRGTGECSGHCRLPTLRSVVRQPSVPAAEMLFTAILAVAVLKRHLNRLHLGGIALCVVRLPLRPCTAAHARADRAPRRLASRSWALPAC